MDDTAQVDLSTLSNSEIRAALNTPGELLTMIHKMADSFSRKKPDLSAAESEELELLLTERFGILNIAKPFGVFFPCRVKVPDSCSLEVEERLAAAGFNGFFDRHLRKLKWHTLGNSISKMEDSLGVFMVTLSTMTSIYTTIAMVGELRMRRLLTLMDQFEVMTTDEWGKVRDIANRILFEQQAVSNFVFKRSLPAFNQLLQNWTGRDPHNIMDPLNFLDKDNLPAYLFVGADTSFLLNTLSRATENGPQNLRSRLKKLNARMAEESAEDLLDLTTLRGLVEDSDEVPVVLAYINQTLNAHRMDEVNSDCMGLYNELCLHHLDGMMQTISQDYCEKDLKTSGDWDSWLAHCDEDSPDGFLKALFSESKDQSIVALYTPELRRILQAQMEGLKSFREEMEARRTQLKVRVVLDDEEHLVEPVYFGGDRLSKESWEYSLRTLSQFEREFDRLVRRLRGRR